MAITVGAERPSAGGGLIAFFLGASVAAVANAAIIWIVYRFADRLTKFIGPTAQAVIVRLTAFLLMCIGVQILVIAIGDLVVQVARRLAPRFMAPCRRIPSGRRA